MFWVYILKSMVADRTYVGQTEDFDARFALHQAGQVRSTAPWRPWEVLHTECFSTRAEALRREKWYKSRAGR